VIAAEIAAAIKPLVNFRNHQRIVVERTFVQTQFRWRVRPIEDIAQKDKKYPKVVFVFLGGPGCLIFIQ